MKKLLLAIAACALTSGASAATKQLISYGESNYPLTKVSYDESGRLTSIEDDTDTYTFDYGKVAQKTLLLTRKEKNYNEVTVYTFTLNDEGNVVKATETENGKVDETYYTFEYADGYMVNYKQIRPDEVEESKITYSEGKITKIENIDGASASENDTETFEYGNVAYLGNLPVFDGVFGIDLDDLEFAFMAGYMGKAPSELPVKSVDTSMYGSDTTTYDWTVDADGYVTKLEEKEADSSWSEIIVFNWAEVSGVDSIEISGEGASRYYTIDGCPANADTKGLVIERKADGTTVKHIR